MGTTLHAFRFAFRKLSKSAGSSLLAVLALGLGIGLTTAAFSLVDAAFLRGLPFAGGERLVRLERVDLKTAERSPVSLSDFLELRKRQSSFDGLSAFLGSSLNVSGAGGAAERANGAFVAVDLFATIHAHALLGRTLQPADGLPEAAPVVLLGYAMWHDRFGKDPAAVGREIRVEGEPHIIVGVMPEGFGFPLRQEIWIPLSLDPGEGGERGEMPLQVLGRLREGVSLASARAALATLAPGVAGERPESRGNVGFVANPYVEAYTEELRPSLKILALAAAGVLLIACLNVANLLAARAVLRRGELALRQALGAYRRQLVTELLAEALLLGGLGIAGGLVVSRIVLAVYLQTVGGQLPSYWMQVRLDGRVLGFAAGITLLAALVCGILPALRVAGLAPAEVLKDTARGFSGLRIGRLTRALVVAEVALAAALLVATGLAVQSFHRLKSLDLGFSPDGLLAGQVSLPATDYPDRPRRLGFYTEVGRRLQALPGVRELAWASSLPGGQVGSVPVRFEGRSADPAGDPRVSATLISPRFFAVLGRSLLAGRDFTAADTPGSPPVVIVNRRFARRFFPAGIDPVGRRIQWGRPGSVAPWRTIVGLAPDLLAGPVEGWPNGPLPAVYAPLYQDPGAWTSLLVRTGGDPLALAPGLRQTIATVDPDLPLFWTDSMAGKLDQGTASYRALGLLISVFGCIALALAALGVYSLMALAVSQEMQEFGLRLALGALRREILGLVLRRGGRQVGLGFLLGLPLAVGLGRWLASSLYGVAGLDPWTFAGAALALAAAGLAACLLPAWRAAQGDPAASLQSS